MNIRNQITLSNIITGISIIAILSIAWFFSVLDWRNESKDAIQSRYGYLHPVQIGDSLDYLVTFPDGEKDIIRYTGFTYTGGPSFEIHPSP